MSNIIKVKQRGKFRKANIFFDKMLTISQYRNIESYARRGVAALRDATPKDTGLTANSWYYEIKRTDNGITIEWLNSNTSGEYNVALMIQYGHGTKNGGYVAGIDYINPALKPIFDEIADDVWKEVNRS
jgi:hypothetical protein